jgi:hypothetical protein
LTNVRNQLRMEPYSRTDFRVNKSWTHDKWKLTLYGEVINLTNRTNYIALSSATPTDDKPRSSVPPAIALS